MPVPSVSTPVGRGERFLARTVRSVLDRTYSAPEPVVLQNAGPDRPENGAAAADRTIADGTIAPGYLVRAHDLLEHA